MFQTIPLQSAGTVLAQAPISIVSVTFHQQLEVSLQQLVVASPQSHQVLEEEEEAFHILVAIPSVNCCCAGQVQQCSHDHHLTLQHFHRVFMASEHRTVTQVQHCFLVLTFGMVVEAIRSPHHSHDPRFDRGPGILAQLLGPGVHVP